MEAFTATTKNMSHSRSISLPSRYHPSLTNVEEHLCRIRSSHTTSTSSLCNRLTGLSDLYQCLDDLLQVPIMHSCDSEDVLGASIRLLDLCNTTKDAFSQMRASVQDLESSLRRREASLSSKISSYLICMKKVNKMVSKCLATFKKTQNQKRNKTSAIASLLGEVEEVSITVFESLFSSIFPAKEITKQNRWSMVFKRTQSKCLHGAGEDKSSEVQKMQMDLEALYKQKTSMQSDFSRIKKTQKCLIALDMNMQQCEEDLDCLFRSLIKSRVSILNAAKVPSVQDLESSLRRRDTDLSNKTRSYLICKKKANQLVSKCFASSKKSKINKSIETPAIVSLLREVEEVSITVFESIFSSICPAKETSKQCRWSMVFKSAQSKRVHREDDREQNINQVQKMDMALNKKSSKTSDIAGTQDIQKCLMALDMNMQECEEKLDCLVRLLIKARVSILNVLNQ